MHLAIINCSPRTKAKSNTNIIIGAFAEGYIRSGNTVEVHHLSELSKWEEIRNAFLQNENILMAIPLFVECIPGIMIEFLDTLEPKDPGAPNKTQLSFLLQGGFAEASQLRCGEQYLEQLPAYFNCEYGGTLIKGNMFVTHMLPGEAAKKTVAPFIEMGEVFAADGRFIKEKSDRFAAPEYFSKRFIAFSNLTSPLKKLFFDIFFGRMGCQGKLSAKPYQAYLSEKSK